MPAALDVDREQVRMLVMQYGVREAARKCELSEDTVSAWSARYGWIKSIPRNIPLPASVLRPAATVVSPVQAMQAGMVEDALNGRASGLRITRRTLARFEQMDDDELILPETVDGVQKTIKSASVVGGYAATSQPQSPGKAFGARASGLEIDAEAIQIDDNPAPDVSLDVNDY